MSQRAATTDRSVARAGAHRLPSQAVQTKRSVVPHEEYLARKYFPALDGLRAVSVLLVLAYHVNSSLWDWLSGAEGVSIFFVISGFIITTMCLREESRDGRLSIRGFYLRRVCRIFPLYFVVLGFYILWVGGLNWHGGRHLLVRSLP